MPWVNATETAIKYYKNTTKNEHTIKQASNRRAKSTKKLGYNNRFTA